MNLNVFKLTALLGVTGLHTPLPVYAHDQNVVAEPTDPSADLDANRGENPEAFGFCRGYRYRGGHEHRGYGYRRDYYDRSLPHDCSYGGYCNNNF